MVREYNFGLWAEKNGCKAHEECAQHGDLMSSMIDDYSRCGGGRLCAIGASRRGLCHGRRHKFDLGKIECQSYVRVCCVQQR